MRLACSASSGVSSPEHSEAEDSGHPVPATTSTGGLSIDAGPATHVEVTADPLGSIVALARNMVSLSQYNLLVITVISSLIFRRTQITVPNGAALPKFLRRWNPWCRELMSQQRSKLSPSHLHILVGGALLVYRGISPEPRIALTRHSSTRCGMLNPESFLVFSLYLSGTSSSRDCGISTRQRSMKTHQTNSEL